MKKGKRVDEKGTEENFGILLSLIGEIGVTLLFNILNKGPVGVIRER